MHSFRLVFRRDYGQSKLKFPLFGGKGASSFKKIDLRTSQNYAWAFGNSSDNFINEVVVRDLQGAIGGDPYSRTRSCHLFVNGVYWGLYQTDERIDDHYAESYNGGDKESYDVVRTFHDERLTFETGVVVGNDEAWHALWKLMDGGFAGAAYPKACGLGPDYTRNPDYPVLLNPTNLMHYMMNVHWTANTDTPSYGPAPNNVAAFRNRVDGQGERDGFLFVLHDCEHALGFGNGKYDSDTTKYGTTEYAGSINGTYAKLSLRVPDGATVYFTLDGSDPRQFGGELNPSASAYDAGRGVAIRTLGMICVNARARDPKGVWSALESVRLNVSSGFMLLIK